MKLRLAIIGLVLVSTSMVILRAVSLRSYLREREAAAYRASCNSRLEQYSREYRQWLELPLTERLGKMWQGNAWSTLSPQQRVDQQAELLAADLEDLASGKLKPDSHADEIYGPNWRCDVADYAKAKRLFHQFRIAGYIGVAVGFTIVGWSLLAVVLRYVMARRKQAGGNNDTPCDIDERENTPPEPLADGVTQGEGTNTGLVNPESQKQCDQAESQEQYDQAELQEQCDQAELQEQWTYEYNPAVRVDRSIWTRPDLQSDSQLDEKAQEEQIVNGIDDDESGDISNSPVKKSDTEAHHYDNNNFNDNSNNNATEDSLPLQDKVGDDSLGKLTQEVTALREFASSQQDHVRKLQDGYDWNILKNFCIRMIRCIDNVDSRMKQLDADEETIMHLEDIRDELIFSLESSGVEQYSPELQSEYYGQEKRVEVLKDRKLCSDPELKGKIAEIVRPGYQYVVSDDNIKIVRTAQVRVFS